MKHCSGLTLIETMIAMTISSFLLIGSMTVFTQTRSVYREAERVARLHENLRFAQATLRSDTQLANYWGRTRRADHIVVAPGVRITCNKRDVTRWALDLSNAVEAHDEVYALPCPGTRPRQQSDVLVIRHARSGIQKKVSGSVQIQSSGRGGTLFRHPVNPVTPEAGSAIFDLAINAYYVSERSNHDPGLPALRRLSLIRGVMHDQEIISGISNLQVQLGIDKDGDNRLDAYIDGRPIDQDQNVIAVHLKLVAASKSPGETPREISQTIYLRNAQPIERPAPIS